MAKAGKVKDSYVMVLVEMVCYPASDLHWKCPCTGDVKSKRIVRKANAVEFHSGDGEYSHWLPDQVILGRYQVVKKSELKHQTL